MLRLTPEALYDEFEAGIEKTRRVLASFEDQIQKRAGPHYFGGPGSGVKGNRRNYYHRWLAYVVPQLVDGPPRAKVTTLANPEGDEEYELEVVGNRWVEDTQLEAFLALSPAIDMQFNFAVVVVAPRPIPGARPIEGVGTDWAPGDPDRGAPDPKVPWAPKFYRVQQDRYWEDALATTRDDIRVQGHIFVRDKNDVLKEGEAGGWDVDAIEEYASDTQLDALKRPDSGTLAGNVKRDEIVGVELWVPEYELEEGNPWGVPASPGPRAGFNGTIFTLLVNRRAIQLSGKLVKEDGKPFTAADLKRPEMGGGFPRKPRPWYGSERGPYVVFGQFGVPNHTLPLGNLTACEEEIVQLDTDVEVAQKRMRNYKRALLLSKGSPAEIQIIKDAEDEGIYRVSGITKDDVHPAEWGGLSDQSLAHIEFSEQNLEASLGLTEMHAGVVSGIGTATEQRQAGNAADARFSGIRKAFNRGVEDLLWRAFGYIYQDNRFAMDVPPEAAQEFVRRGMAEPELVMERGRPRQRPPSLVYLGGERQGQKRIPYNALSVAIDAETMGRQGHAEAQFRASNLLGATTTLVPLVAQFPRFPWQKVATKIGNAMGFPGFGEMFAHPDEIAAGAIEVATLTAQAGAAPGGQGSSKSGGAGAKRIPVAASVGGARAPGRSQKTAQERGPAGGRSRGGTGQTKTNPSNGRS